MQTTYNSLWIGNSISYIERLVSLCNLRTLPKNSVRLYVYEDLTNLTLFDGLIAHGLVLSDANSVIPRSKVFMNPDRPSYAAFSNLFRYKILQDELLRKNTAFWLDSDYILFNEPDFNSIYLGWESEKIVNGAIFGVSPNNDSDIVNQFVNKLLIEGEARRHGAAKWGTLGPRLISEIMRSDFPELEKFVRSAAKLYPISYQDTHKLFEREHFEFVSKKTAHCDGLHLWNEAFRGVNPSPRDFRPPDGSYMNFLAQGFEDEVIFKDTPNQFVPQKSLRDLRGKVDPPLSRRVFNRIKSLGISSSALAFSKRQGRKWPRG